MKQTKWKRHWSKEVKVAFDQLKYPLMEATCLIHPCESSLKTHPIWQFWSNYWMNKPLEFFFEKTEQCSTCMLTNLLEGWTFTLRADHNVLIYALKRQSDRDSLKQLHLLDFINQFNINSGNSNLAVDTLSRLEEVTVPVITVFKKVLYPSAGWRTVGSLPIS